MLESCMSYVTGHARCHLRPYDNSSMPPPPSSRSRTVRQRTFSTTPEDDIQLREEALHKLAFSEMEAQRELALINTHVSPDRRSRVTEMKEFYDEQAKANK